MTIMQERNKVIRDIYDYFESIENNPALNIDDGAKTRGKIFIAIILFRHRLGYSPSVRELATMLDMTAGNIQYHLNIMEFGSDRNGGIGVIKRTPHLSRSIVAYPTALENFPPMFNAYKEFFRELMQEEGIPT